MKRKLSLLITYITCLFIVPVNGQNNDWTIEVQHGLNDKIITEQLTNSFFIDSNYGWASGDRLLKKTIDGGLTWSEIVIPESNFLNVIFFLDAKTGWVGDIGCEFLFHTKNGGESWEKIQLELEGIVEYRSSIEKIIFLNPNNGFMLSGGVFMETQDGGKTWANKQHKDKYFTSFCFIDKNTGWALHRLGAFKTIDGGKNWVEVKNISIKKDENIYPYWNEGILTDISFFDLQNGMITATMPDSLGYLLLTSDGGKTWQKKSGPVNLLNTSYSFPEELLDRPQYSSLRINYVDKNNVYFESENKVFHSADNCNSFSKMNTEIYPNYSWNSISFISEKKALITAGIGLFLTDDGGKNWTPLNDIPPQRLIDVFFINLNLGWAVGHGGIILKTVNGGESWENQISNTKNNLLSVMFITPSIGWVTSEKGEILYTQNGGNEWVVNTIIKDINPDNVELKYLKEYYPDLTYPPVFSKRVSMIDLKFGWLIGESAERIEDAPCIFFTEDGGITWTEVENKDKINFVDIYFQNKTNAYAVSSNTLLNSKDGCKTWHKIDINNQNLNFTGIQYAGSSTLILMIRSSILNYNTSSGEIKENKLPAWGTRSNVSFLNTELGWYIMPPHSTKNVYTTINGGENWNPIIPEDTVLHNILSHFAINEKNIWLVGEYGLIIKLTNNQKSKQEESTNEIKEKMNNVRDLFKR